MKIDISNWKEYSLYPKYFDVVAGKYHYPDEYEKGTTPYVTASNINNGVSEYISISPEFKGNCIVTGKVGCTAFYQPAPFCATSDVNIFVPKFRMSSYVGLFLVTIINKNENYRWQYGRQCRVGNSKKIKLLLPQDEHGNPDWEWMEKYIKSLHHKPITTAFPSSNSALDIDSWSDFVFGNLIKNGKIYKAKSHAKSDLVTYDNFHDGLVPFVTRTEENNSVDCFVDPKDLTSLEKGNAITIGDTTSTIAYQPAAFGTGDHIVVIRADWLNIYTGMFIVSILNRERFRYSYGRAFLKQSIIDTVVKLPATADGAPDWDWMEQYIKTLPYSDRIG